LDAEQFTLPFFGQVRQRDNQHHLQTLRHRTGDVLLGGVHRVFTLQPQPPHITAHDLLRAETLNALLNTLAIQFVGVERDVPALRCGFEKLPFTAERIEQTMCRVAGATSDVTVA
jgi:hypothetical protein